MCGFQAGQLDVNIEINLHADDAAGQVQRNQVTALFDVLNGGNAGDGQDACLSVAFSINTHVPPAGSY